MWEKLGSGLGPDKGLVKIRCCSEDTTRPPSWIQLLFSLSVMSDCVTPWTVARWVPLTMGFPRQESWRGLPFPSPGDLPDPGIKPESPALQADSLPTELQRKKPRSICPQKDESGKTKDLSFCFPLKRTSFLS